MIVLVALASMALTLDQYEVVANDAQVVCPVALTEDDMTGTIRRFAQLHHYSPEMLLVLTSHCVSYTQGVIVGAQIVRKPDR